MKRKVLITTVLLGIGIAMAGVIVFVLRLRSLEVDQRSPASGKTRRELAVLLDRADRAATAGNREQAGLLLREVLERDPRNSAALLHLAVCAESDGDHAGARLLLDRVPRSDPSTLSKILYLEGSIELKELAARNAESCFLRSTAASPEYLPPLKELIRLYSLQLRESELRDVLNAVAGIRTPEAEEAALRLLAGKPVMESSFALERLRAFLTGDPDDVESLVAIVRYLIIEGDYAAARELAVSCPRFHDQHPTLRLASLNIDDPEERDRIQSCIAGISGHPELLRGDEMWEIVNSWFFSAGDFETALEIAQFRRHRFPFSVSASHATAAALDRIGRFADAEQERIVTGHLDQIEILAYRILRPQAANPGMAIPVMRELAERLKTVQRPAEAREWITMADLLSLKSGISDPGLQALLESAEGKASHPASAPKLSRLSRVAVPIGTAKSAGSFADSPRTPEGATEWNFVDVSEAMAVDFEYHNGRSRYKRILETVGGGSVALDVDGDLRPDLFFPQGQRYFEVDDSATDHDGHPLRSAKNEPLLNDQFYRNQRGTGFQNCTEVAGILNLAHSLAATSGDFDNDGFPDVFIANAGISRLFRNNGDGTFSDVTPLPMSVEIGSASCACFADFDEDGNLDLFVVNYVSDWEKRCINSDGEFATCDPRDLKPSHNVVYRNLGDGQFENVSVSSGIADLFGRGLGVVAADLTGDQRIDVFVANDGMPNFLLKNESEAGAVRFREIAALSGVAVPESGRSHAGMGVAVDDFDRNGYPDIFVTNFFREQNTLYAGIGDEIFVDHSRFSGLGPVSLPLLGFGVQSIDVEMNGRPDLIVMNGDIDDYSSSGRPWKMASGAYRNLGGGRFSDMSRHSGQPLTVPQLGRGLTRIDLDGDGRDDLVAVRHDGIARLLLNQTPSKDVSATFHLRGRYVNRDAIGTNVVFGIGSNGRASMVSTGDGFAARNESVLRIPGRQCFAQPLTVWWTNKQETVIAGPDEAGNWVIREESDHSATLWLCPQ